MQNRLQKRPGVKSKVFQELEDQCYPVLKLEDEIQTFAIVGGPKVDLTLLEKPSDFNLNQTPTRFICLFYTSNIIRTIRAPKLVQIKNCLI
jgi:hypothetical protein